MINNILLNIPSTIDPASLDDKKAYFINYLYTYPFIYKHRVKAQVLSQKNYETELEGERYLRKSGEIEEGLDHVADQDPGQVSCSDVSGYFNFETFYSNVFTSENYIQYWDGYIPIHSDWMKKQLTFKDYTRVRDELYSTNIIDIDWSYSNFEHMDKYPMAYKLTDEHRFSTTAYSIDYPKSRFLKKRVEQSQEYYHSLTPLLKLLSDKIYQVDFDYNGASEFVLHNEFKSRKTKKISSNAKLSRILATEIMKERSPLNYYLHEGNKVKRVFSPITSLPQDLRPYLSHNNQFLWDTDMSCALPTLFNIHLANLNTEDVKLYRWLTSEKEDNFGLYEYLGELWDVNDRDEVKILTMVLFFGNNYTIRDYRKSFRQAFPTVYNVMYELKRENYKFLAGNLMNLERKIMIDTVVNDILTQDSDTMILTIHDGILTTEEQTIKVKNRIEEAIKDVIGFKPKVKIKSLKK